jgi:hypothetical protein
MDFAEIWHGAQRRQTEEISSDIYFSVWAEFEK